MRLRDVIHLLIKPFLGKDRGPTKNELLSRAVEHRALKDTAADLTAVPDVLLEGVIGQNRHGPADLSALREKQAQHGEKLKVA
jgi:hypothetical protein